MFSGKRLSLILGLPNPRSSTQDSGFYFSSPHRHRHRHHTVTVTVITMFMVLPSPNSISTSTPSHFNTVHIHYCNYLGYLESKFLDFTAVPGPQQLPLTDAPDLLLPHLHVQLTGASIGFNKVHIFRGRIRFPCQPTTPLKSKVVLQISIYFTAICGTSRPSWAPLCWLWLLCSLRLCCASTS